jgi:imidazolonepropionase-like amidohydrolase
MRWILPIVLLAACGRDKAAPKPPPPKPHHAVAGDLAIVDTTVIPMDREGTLTAHTVLVRDGAIALVAPSDDVDTAGATVIDGHGKWLMPGLADMHVHFWSEGDLVLFLLEGVTTVRNLFGSPEHLQWRDAVAKGERDGPTILSAGPILDGDPPVWPGSDVVTTAEQAKAAVHRQHDAGYDWLKVYNGLPAEAYEAILAEAKVVGMPVGGHVPDAVGIARVIDSGQRTIEHLDGYVGFRGNVVVDQATVDATAKSGVWNCPTLVVTDRFAHLDDVASLADTRGLELVTPMIRGAWDPKSDFRLRNASPTYFEEARKRNVIRRTLLADLHAAGAKLVLGTDTGNPYVIPGFAVGDELTLLIAAGLSNWQALHTATAAAAEMLGTPGAFGVVAKGARADLVLLDADPLANISAVFDPAVVIARGKLHRHDELLAAAQARLAPVGDRFASMPALTPTARYEVVFQGAVIGEERAVISATAVEGQIVVDAPARIATTYRATADRLEMSGDGLPGGLVVSRTAGGARAVLGTTAPIDQEAPKTAVIAPQAIAEFVWYAQRLADLAPGGTRALDTVEVMTDTGVQLQPAHFDFVRKPDSDGRRVYTIAGKHGAMDLTGTFSVDADGAPHEVSLEVPFGSFAMRRVP